MAKRGGLSWGLHEITGALVAVTYVVLGLTDMTLSSAAFVLGIPEANPFLAWLAAHGLFIPAKVGLTIIAAGLIAWLYPRGKGRPVAWTAVLLMLGVNLYHVWGFTTL